MRVQASARRDSLSSLVVCGVRPGGGSELGRTPASRASGTGSLTQTVTTSGSLPDMQPSILRPAPASCAQARTTLLIDRRPQPAQQLEPAKFAGGPIAGLLFPPSLVTPCT